MSLFHKHELDRSPSPKESSDFGSNDPAEGHSKPAEAAGHSHERRASLFGRLHSDRLKHPNNGGDDKRAHDVSDPAKLTAATTIRLPVSRRHQVQEHQEHRDVAPEAVSRVRAPDTKPKQPTNIQDSMECALEPMDQKQGDTGEKASEANHSKSRHSRETSLTTRDIKYLFSGAPHFMLERAKHDLWYPQVIFPWDLHDQSIQDLWDRQPLRHESFALSTLHAHLPVPDNLTPDGVSKHQITDKQPRSGSKRPTFDADAFEVPSMLSMNGKEPGCVGFRYFLELPVADSVHNKPHLARPEVDRAKLAQLPASEAFDALQHLRDPYSECNQDMVLDRHKLICEGPRAWKRIGVREIHIKAIAERLEELGKFWTELFQGKTTTILDKESPDTLSKNLYTNFLYPPTNLLGHRDPRHLKAQIEILTEVLAVKGAWVDFSLVEWRLRVGQILWETTPHADGDCIDPKNLTPEDGPRHLLLEQGEERKWLLLQLLLAAELLVRLDAVFRVEILQKPTNPSVTAGEMHYLDKLRHGKVNWDLAFVQRFFDNLTIKYRPPPTPPQSPPSEDGQAQSKTSTSDEKVSRRRSFLSRIGGFRHHQHTATASTTDTGCAWDCIIMPRRAEQQLQGLFIFADAIGWPDRDRFEETIWSKLQMRGEGPNQEALSAIYSSPIHHEQSLVLEKKEMYRKGSSRQLVVLHEPRHTSDHEKAGSSNSDIPADIGGWMSRSWLTGSVLPGEAISHFLMVAILENDKNAMAKLGRVANLFGGFQYKDQSWWSIKCIVARVLSALDNTATYIGWTKINVSPHDASTGQVLENTWFEVDSKSVPFRAVSRIHQGSKVALESNPLGRGEVSSNTFSIPVDEGPSTDIGEIVFRKLTLATLDTAEPERPNFKGITAAREASVSFDLTTTRHVDDESSAITTTITFPLAYDVYFISSHSCRPPPGYAHRGCSTQKPQQSSSPRSPTSSDQQQPSVHNHHNHSHLPGHPLHSSYTYKYVPLTSLRSGTRAPAPLFSSDSEHGWSAHPPPGYRHHHRHDNSHNTHQDEIPSREPVWIIDARGSHEKDAFARAWCAAAGTSAVVSRVGRTCLACSIREARAVDVGVVIRIGRLDK